MDEKEIIYQFLSREIDNIIYAVCPGLNVLAAPLKKYLFAYIDPYIDLFFNDDNMLNTQIVKEYAIKETSDKIKEFVAKYENERESEINRKITHCENKKYDI